MVSRDDTEGLASEAQEMGLRVLRGLVPNAGAEGTQHVGAVEMQELLHEMAAQEVLVIVAPLGPAREERSVCPRCRGTHQGGECPVCRREHEEAKRVVEERLLFDEGFFALLCW